MKRTLSAMALCLLATSVSAADLRIGEGDVSQPYLFDAIKQPAIRKPIEQLLTGKTLPDWTAAILSGGAYVAGAPRTVETVMPGATAYTACMQHDCHDNAMAILVTGDRRKAFAIIREGSRIRFIGAPDRTAESILKTVLGN